MPFSELSSYEGHFKPFKKRRDSREEFSWAYAERHDGVILGVTTWVKQVTFWLLWIGNNGEACKLITVGKSYKNGATFIDLERKKGGIYVGEKFDIPNSFPVTLIHDRFPDIWAILKSLEHDEIHPPLLEAWEFFRRDWISLTLEGIERAVSHRWPDKKAKIWLNN